MGIICTEQRGVHLVLSYLVRRIGLSRVRHWKIGLIVSVYLLNLGEDFYCKRESIFREGNNEKES